MISLIFYKVSIQDESLSDVIVISLLLYRLIQSFLDIQNNWQRINECSPGVFLAEKTIFQLFDHSEKVGKGLKANFRGTITFENVCFNYGKTKVLSDINLNFKNNSILVISGKSCRKNNFN